MAKIFVFLVLTFLIALAPFSTDCCFLHPQAMTDEQRAKIHEHFEAATTDCIKDNPISDDDLNSIRSKMMPSGENSPCFLNCIMKKVGLMDESGMLHSESDLEFAHKVFDNEEQINMMGDYLHSCVHVNSETVSDGEKGCDRAIMAYKCLIDNASKFGFNL